jgi:mono/diheme cytochrome c family protein
MMLRPTRWMAVALLGLWACEPAGPAPPADFGSLEARVRGRTLYLEHCALCHGELADGRGRRRQSLSGPPADFTDPFWSRRTPPRRIFQIVRNGVPGTSMAAWKVLDDQQIWDLASYLHGVAEHGALVKP